MSFVTLGGLATYYRFAPDRSGPALVFINSLGTDLRLWEALLDELPGQHAVLRYDLRGHGLTDAPEGPYALADFAMDLQALIEHLGLTELALIGISIGGMIALEFAARNPGRARALVLLDTAAHIGPAERWEQRAAAVQQRGLRPLVPEVLKIWFSDSFAARQPAAWNGFRNMLARCSPTGYAASCAALRDADLTERVGAVQAPTLVLTGEHDRATTVEDGRRLAGSMPNARFEPIAGAAHLACVEQPARVAQALSAFLKEQGYA